MKMKYFKEKKEPRIDKSQLRDRLGLNRIIISTHLLNAIANRARPYPASEEGGVLIGYIEDDWDPLNGFTRSLADLRILNFVPSGPRTIRSASALYSDLEFQEYEFQRLREVDPSIQHLGSWHSHHCNGLKRLSSGDLNSYFNILHSVNHSHDYYIAILLHTLPESRLRGADAISRCFSFYVMSRRTGQRTYLLDSSCVEFTQDLLPFTDLIDSGDDLPHELVLEEKCRRTWFRQQAAKGILKNDTAILSSIASEHSDVRVGTLYTMEGPISQILVRRFRMGSYLIEYQYPGTDATEGILIVVMGVLQDGTVDEILRVVARPLAIRHEVFSILLECLASNQYRYQPQQTE